MATVIYCRTSLQSLASAHPRNFLLNSQAHLGMGENLARWHRVRKVLKIYSATRWQILQSCSQTTQNVNMFKTIILLAVGRYYLYICQLSLHTCNFCKISLHTGTPEILSCTPEISSKTAILCSLAVGCPTYPFNTLPGSCHSTTFYEL